MNGAALPIITERSPGIAMTDIDTSGARKRRRLGFIVSAIGLAHFVFPASFDPVNRLGFSDRARTFTYVNGALETTIGVLIASPRRRRATTFVSACYTAYLTVSVIRTQLLERRA